MTKDNATKRPWHTRSGDCCIRIVEKSLPEGFSDTICEVSIGSFNCEANAKLIVKAVNCHDELVEALKEVIKERDFYFVHPKAKEMINKALKKASE